MPEKKTNDKLRVAFWRYDTFPYVLGDQGEFDADGNFRAFSYGKTFLREAIIAVLPPDTGKAALTRLESLRRDNERRQAKLKVEMLDMAMGVLPELKDYFASIQRGVRKT